MIVMQLGTFLFSDCDLILQVIFVDVVIGPCMMKVSLVTSKTF